MDARQNSTGYTALVSIASIGRITMEQTDLHTYRKKIKTLEELKQIIGPRPRQKKVIMCHGTFDIVHPGHIRHLLFAKSKGDILVASLTCDAHIGKANMRPYVPEYLRAINLAAFEMVDYVIVDYEKTPLTNIQEIQPDYFCKGYEYVQGGALHPKTKEESDIIDSYGGEIIFTPGDVVYSSSHLIETHMPNLAAEKLMLLMDAEKLSFEDLTQTLKHFQNIKVHVVGDTIIDSFTHCTMIGGMTKTPTMSVRYDRRQDYVGGAAVVAKHLKAAGAQVTFSTILGDDDLKDYVLNDLEQAGIKTQAIIDSTRPTTNKNAVVVGTYRLLKIDTLDNRSISDKVLKKLTSYIEKTSCDVIVFSDFRHGIFSKETIPSLINAIPENIIKVADSQVASRWGNILDFKGFDLITPNEREARFALGDQDSVIRPLGTELYKQSGSKLMILKVGERGAMVFRNRDEDDVRGFFTLDSFCTTVVDPVGAGDALLAYATLGLASSKNPVLASILGGCAAAIECEKDGNIPVFPKDITDKIENLEEQMTYRKSSLRKIA